MFDDMVDIFHLKSAKKSKLKIFVQTLMDQYRHTDVCGYIYRIVCDYIHVV